MVGGGERSLSSGAASDAEPGLILAIAIVKAQSVSPVLHNGEVVRRQINSNFHRQSPLRPHQRSVELLAATGDLVLVLPEFVSGKIEVERSGGQSRWPSNDGSVEPRAPKPFVCP